MGKKPEVFFVNGSDGQRHKVKPGTRRFRGGDNSIDRGDYRLSQATVVNGTSFEAGWYPFVFWSMPIFDQHDNPITDSGIQPDPSGINMPELSHSYDHGSSSYDGGSSGVSYDGGSSGGSDSGGGDGGSGGF